MAVAEIELLTTNDQQPATDNAPEGRKERLLALDVFRGLTVASMLLVNNPGTWSAIYPPLGHAQWHGWTPTDLIFPFFLFIVGVTTHLSLSSRRAAGADERALVIKVIRRGLLIVLFGLLLNAFPFYWWGRIADTSDPTLLQRVIHRFDHLRWPGVLQRIGVVYLIAGLLTVKLSRRQIIVTTAALLLGYWAIMSFGPLEPPESTIAARVDRAVIGEKHIWSSSKTWDPEGVLSTIPAVGTALFGVLAGMWIANRQRPLADRVLELFGFGALAMVAGRFWGAVFPINKGLWTSSYVVFTAGFACIALATCLWLIDIRQLRGWTKPFVIYGVNPLVAFVGSGMMARLLGVIKVNYAGKPVSLQAASYRLLFEPYFEPRFASMLWGLSFVALWLGILWIFYRRNWYLRV
jgi:predicted acyltransferase